MKSNFKEANLDSLIIRKKEVITQTQMVDQLVGPQKTAKTSKTNEFVKACAAAKDVHN